MTEVFTPEMNWLSSLIEEHEYETTLFQSYDDTDQRISLMELPHRRLTYSITAMEERESGLLEGLIRKVQAEICYVPYWRGARYVQSFAGNQIFANTLFAGFEIDHWAMVFTDPYNFQIVKITNVLSDRLIVTPVVSGSFPLGRTRVVPIFRGQLAPDTDLDYQARFAKAGQVVFDLYSDQRVMSADCNWGIFIDHPIQFPLSTTWVIDPTAGPDGGPAMRLTIPANSHIGGSVYGQAAYIRIVGLPVGASFTMEAKVKTDWNIATANPLDGIPYIALAIESPPAPGTAAVATGAAFNAWQNISTTVSTDADGEIVPTLNIGEGTFESTPRHAWFADIVIRNNAGTIIHTCLPHVEDDDPGMTPIFAPLTALHRPGQSAQKTRRSVTQMSSPAGVFSIRPRSNEPVGEHALDLVFMNAQEWYAFRAFHDKVMGAYGAFWVPSYQQDLTPVGVIGSAAVTFNIKHIGYTTKWFPSLNRRQIAFVQPNGSFVKRTITASVDNGDGTETVTINAALGSSFQQNNANGICFLWYGRFLDDVARTEWIAADQATISIGMVELRDPPDGGSGISGDGYLLDEAP